jgi:hypothetical protein
LGGEVDRGDEEGRDSGKGEDMSIFYLTFGQQHPLRNGWIEVEVDIYMEAREAVFEVFGNKWSGLYDEEHFKKELFPEGSKGRMNLKGVSYGQD